MCLKISFTVTVVLIIYLAMLLLVNFSFGALWIDETCAAVLAALSFLLAFNSSIEKTTFALLLRLMNMALAVAVFGYLGLRVLS